MNYANLKVPNHVAIIVDGNGRWALENGKTRSYGHKKGAENLLSLSEYIFSKGIKVLSLYVFSTENFKRSDEEVSYLMGLFIKMFEKEFSKMHKKNIRIVFSGRAEPLPKEVLKTIQDITEMTKDNNGSIINFCLNYGGHSEIVDATKKIHNDVLSGNLNINDLNEEIYSKYLYNDLPPVDFLIRTSGEERISNFMLWHISYAEFYFTKTFFPAFKKDDFDKAIIEYTKRDRRYGGIDYEN